MSYFSIRKTNVGHGFDFQQDNDPKAYFKIMKKMYFVQRKS